jgi:hypothetical protein
MSLSLYRAARALALVAPLVGLAARAEVPEAIRLIERAEALLGSTYASVTKALGPPIRTAREIRDNRHDESFKEEIIKLSYPWGEVTVERAMIGTPHERELLESMVVRSNVPQLPDLPRFGSRRSSLVERFGSPEEGSSETLLRYSREDGEAQPHFVTFRFVDGRLAEIWWTFGVD